MARDNILLKFKKNSFELGLFFLHGLVFATILVLSGGSAILPVGLLCSASFILSIIGVELVLFYLSKSDTSSSVADQVNSSSFIADTVKYFKVDNRDEVEIKKAKSELDSSTDKFCNTMSKFRSELKFYSAEFDKITASNMGLMAKLSELLKSIDEQTDLEPSTSGISYEKQAIAEMQNLLQYREQVRNTFMQSLQDYDALSLPEDFLLDMKMNPTNIRQKTVQIDGHISALSEHHCITIELAKLFFQDIFDVNQEVMSMLTPDRQMLTRFKA